MRTVAVVALVALALLLVVPCSADDLHPVLFDLGPETGVVPVVQTPNGPVALLPGGWAPVLPGFSCPCGPQPWPTGGGSQYVIPSRYAPFTPVGQPPALPPNLWHPGEPAPAGNPGNTPSTPAPTGEPSQGWGGDSPHSK